MKITAIKVQIKKTDRFSIFVDEKYSFSLNEYQLANMGLHINQELTAEELDNLKNDSDFGKAYERVLNYLSIRPHSQKEIEDYLTRTYLYPKPKSYIDKLGQRIIKKQEVDKAKVLAMNERVINRLQEKGYINDEDFALAWARSRQSSNKTSKRKLILELRAKGVNQDLVENTLQEIDFDETSALKQLIAKKQKLTRYKNDKKLIQFLLQRGFNYDEIKSAMKDLSE